MGFGDLPVSGGDVLGDGGLFGFELSLSLFAGALEGEAAGLDVAKGVLGLGAHGFRLGGGFLKCQLGFGDLRLGGGVGSGGSLGFGDGLGDGGEGRLAGGFTAGEFGFDLCGGFLGGGDVSAGAGGGARLIADHLLGHVFKFSQVAGGDHGVTGVGDLGEIDFDRGGEAELDAFIGRDQVRLKRGAFGGVATLADLQVVVLRAVKRQLSRRAAHQRAVEANRGAARAGLNLDDIGE